MAGGLVPDGLWNLIEPLLPNSVAQAARRATAPDRPGLPRGHYFPAP